MRTGASPSGWAASRPVIPLSLAESAEKRIGTRHERERPIYKIPKRVADVAAR